MYDKYHEMDIHQFIDAVLEIQSLKHTESKLRRLRKYAAFSRSQLAERSGVPVRTIQQYEQGQKDIKKASFAAILNLSRALSCSPNALI